MKVVMKKTNKKLEYFRKLLLDHLDTLDGGEAVNKAMNKGAAMPVGTVRDWKGQKYIKISKDKWARKYDEHTRDAKMALSALKRKIAAAKNEREIMRIVLLNHDRFSDKYGNPLPFVQELHDYIEGQKAVKEKAKKKKISKTTKPKQKKQTEKIKKKEPIGIIGGHKDVKIVGTNFDAASEAIDIASNYDKKGLSRDDAIKQIIGLGFSEKEAIGVVEYHHDYMNKVKERQKKESESIKPDENKNKGYDRTYKNGYFGGSKEAEDLLNEIDKYELDLRSREKELERLNNRIASGGIGKQVLEWLQEDIEHTKEFNERTRRDIAAAEAKLKEIQEKPNNPAISGVELVDDKGNVNPELKGKTPDDLFKEIQKKYQSAKVIEGDNDEIQVGKETLPGKWKLVEADTPTASHDETTFQKTPGFPTNADGTSINDRDYEHFEANKEAVLNIANDFDGRALKFDSPIVVTTDGVVISGNNRTMSSKIAAKKGTDKKYIEALKKRAKKFGFTEAEVGEFKNPRVVFEVEQKGGYSTSQFAKFNQSGKKEMGPTEKAIKVSKIIKPETIETVAEKINEFDTIGELYQDVGASRQIYELFKNAGLIGENEAGRYFENGSLTNDGKAFIETALLGTVITESNLRGFNRPGCKSIRATLLKALIPLVENKGLSGYSINKELNEAVDIAMQVAINKDKFRNIEEFAQQDTMFESFDPVAVELAKKLEGTQKEFAEFMQTMNGGLKVAANGEADIFLGGVETRDDILSRILKVGLIKKSVDRVFRLLNIRKSLTYSGHPLQGRTKVQGMYISIENKKGSTRKGVDKDGHNWKCKMHHDYGYIRGTVGVDKDHLNAYVGDNPESETVYIVNQNDPVTGKFDEQKVMLGFESIGEAKKAYMKQYDRPGFFGGIISMSIDDFKEEAFNIKNKGKPIMVKSADKLEYFRKFILDHLDGMEEKDGVMQKARGFPVGTTREWGGQKYKKTAPNKWMPIYDSHTRGAKAAVSAIKRKIDQAKDFTAMLDIVTEHRERFSDEKGNPLPFVQELHSYAIARGQEMWNKEHPMKVNPEDIVEGSIVTYPSRSGKGGYEKGKVLAVYDRGEVRTDTDGVISDTEIVEVDNTTKYEWNGSSYVKADEKPKEGKQALNGGNNNGGGDNGGEGFKGSVATGDTVTGKDADTGESVIGKVTLKGKEGVMIKTKNGESKIIRWEGLEVKKRINENDAIRNLYDEEGITGDWRYGDSGLQPESCDNIGSLLEAAEKDRENLNKVTAKYAEIFHDLSPILIKRPKLKGIKRIKEKLRADEEAARKKDPEYKEHKKGELYDEETNTYHCRTIRDTDGHTLTLKNVADVGKLLHEFNTEKTVIRIKNNFAKPSKLGYSDINMNIRLPNGTIAEIQLNTTANLVAKERYGHSMFEVWRTLDGIGGNVAERHSKLLKLMEDGQKALYGKSNEYSKDGTFRLSDAVQKEIDNGNETAFFTEENPEYAKIVKPFVEKAMPLFEEAVKEGLFPDTDEGKENETIGHFKDLARRLKIA